MSKPELLDVTEDLQKVMENTGLGDAVSIALEKMPGSESAKRHVQASSPAAAVNGLAVLIRDMAAEVGVPVVHILSVLAVILLGPAHKEAADGKDGI